MPDHSAILSLAIEVVDRASGPMRMASAEMAKACDQTLARLRELEVEAKKVDAETQRYQGRLAALKAETAAAGQATAAQTKEMRALEAELAKLSGRSAAASAQQARGSKAAAAETAALAGATRRAGAEHDAAAKRAERHGNAVTRLGAGMQTSGRRMTDFGHQVGGVTIPILAVGAASGKMAMDFDASMERLHGQAGASTGEVKKMTKAVLDMAPAVGVGPQKLADSLYHVESVGLRGGKALDVLREAARGAKVGGADLEHVTNALTAAMKTAPKDITGAADAMGLLNSIVGQGNMRMADLTAAMSTGVLDSAKGLGLGMRDVGAALDVLTARGVPAEEASTRLKMSFNLMANPTAKARDALQAVGLSSDRLAQDMRKPGGLVIAIQDLKTHLEKSGLSAVEQSHVISQAFGGGRTSSTIVSLKNNAADLKKQFDALPSSAEGIDRLRKAEEAYEKTPKGKIEHDLAKLQDTAIRFGNDVLPVAIPIIDKAAGTVGHLAHMFEGLPGPVKKAGIEIAAVGAVAGPVLIGLGKLDRLAGGGVRGLGRAGGILGGMGGRGGPGNPLYVVAEGGVGGRGGAGPAGVALPGAAAGEAAGAAAGASWASRFGARVKGAMPGIGMAAGVVMAPSLIEQVAKDFGDKKHGLPRKLADALHDSTPLHFGPDAPHGDQPVKGAPSPKHYDPYLDPVRNPALRLHPGAPLRIGQPTAAATASTLQHDYSVFKQAGDATGLAHVQAALRNAEKEFPKARAQFAAMSAGIAADIQRLNQAPVDVGKHMVDELKKAGAATPKIIRDTLAEIGKLPPGAQHHAAQTAIGMANQLASKGGLPKGEAKKIADALAGFFASGATRSVGSSAAMVAGIAANMGKLDTTVHGGVDKMGAELNAALKGLGVGTVNFGSQLTGLFANAKGHALGGRLAAFAAGGRIPGAAKGDHIPLLGAGGGLLGIADGGELVVNQHTERDIDTDLLMMGRPTVGQRVAGETRPHAQRFATGGRVVGTSTYGGPHDPSTPGDSGAYGHLRGTMGFAELGMGSLLGHLAPHSKHLLTYGNKSVMGVKLDIGAGGAPVQGHTRALDLWWETARALGFPEPGVGLVGIDGAGAPNAGGGGSGAQQIARVLLGGPAGGLKSLGQGTLDKARSAMNAKLAASAPAGGAMAFSGAGLPGGLSKMDGQPVAAWIASILNQARGAGVGFNVTSGYRSAREQASLQGGPGPVAPAGASHHQGIGFPDGAVDVVPAGPLDAWLHGHPNVARGLTFAGGKDPVHFSVPGAHRPGETSYGRGGRVAQYAGAFGDGGQFTVDRPTAFIAGEKGAETVSVLPHLATGGSLDQRLAAIHAHGHKGRAPAKSHEGYNPLTDRIESHTSVEWAHIHAEIAKHNHDHPHHRLHTTAPKHPQYETRVIEDLARGHHAPLGSFTSHTRGPIHLGSDPRHQHAIDRMQGSLWNQVAAAAMSEFGKEDTDTELRTLGGLMPHDTPGKHGKHAKAGHLNKRLADLTGKMTAGALASIDKDFTAHKDTADKAIKSVGIRDKLKGVDESSVQYWNDQATAIQANSKALLGDKSHLQSLLASARKRHDKKAITSITAKLGDVQDAIDQGLLDGMDARQKMIAATLAGFEHSASLASTGVQILQGMQHLAGTDQAGLGKLKDTQGGFLTPAQQAQADQALGQYIGGVRAQEAPLQGELGYEQSIIGSLHGQAQMDAQQKIADLSLQIVSLEGSIKDQTDATKDLKSSTDKQTTATAQLTGSVVFTYQGQSNVVAERPAPQSSSSTVHLGVGM